MARLKLLERELGKMFKPQAIRTVDVYRRAREVAKLLAKQYDIIIEREGSVLVVWPSRTFEGVDPWEGDHGCQNWNEVLLMVRTYAGFE